MNPDQTAMDPTLLQLLNELIRAHAQIQRLQQRIMELENKNGSLPAKVAKDAVTQ